MKRSSDDSPRARHEDALRHRERPSAPHTSRRHLDQPERLDREDLLDATPQAGARVGTRVNRLQGAGSRRVRGESRSESRGELLDDEVDAGMSRLEMARQRQARQRMTATTLLFVVPTAVFSLMLMAMAHVVFRDWRSYESERRIAQAQLTALQEQLDVGQRRLNSLRSPKGREQILAEHGYLRPGDRMLLFPHRPGEENPNGSNDIASDIAARRATIRDGASSSAWDRAARTMTGWLGEISGRAKPAPSTSGASNAASNAAAPPSTASAEEEGEEAGEAISPEERIVRPSASASP
jgi:hypothetical protein